MPVPTSVLIASCAEVKEALSQGFVFPALAIPFGADETTPCRFFVASDEIAPEDIAALLERSHPMPDGVRRVHLIHAPRTGIANFTPDAPFRLTQT